MAMKYYIFISLLILSNSTFAKSTFDIFVNYELALKYSQSGDVDFVQNPKLPNIEKWEKVIIFSDSSKKTFFSDWQKKHKRTSLILQADGDTYNVQVTQEHKSFTITNASKIIITTSDFKPQQTRAKMDGPTFTIHKGNKTFLIKRDLLENNKEKMQRQGWTASWIISQVTDLKETKHVTLDCKAKDVPILIPNNKLSTTYIKLNKRNLWRATVTEGQQNNKSKWVRCKGLTDIHLY